ncbi:hypothetical protein Tco_1466958 [Tanacetum coccineum]
MKNYVEPERLGYVLPQDLTIGLILNGLTSDFVGFVRNYNMHNIGKTIGELHAMLIEYEKGLPKKAKTPQVMMIKCGKIQKANKKSLNAKGKGKANGKGNDKQVYIPKPKNPKPSTKEHPSKDDTCHCKEVGHWKRNCLVYLAEFLKKKKQVGSASSSGVFRIELFAFPNKSWVHDTGCGTHICITKQGFREAKKLKQGALYLYVGNCVRAQVEAIRSCDLVLPNGLVICLDNSQNGSIYDESYNSVVILLGLCSRVCNTHSQYCFQQTKKVDKTLYELWYGKVPNLSYLKVWGFEALVKRDTPDKLQQISVKCIFIGYPKEIMGYYLLSIENKIVFASMLSSLFEKNLHNSRVSVRAMDLDEIQDERYITYEITSEFPKEG